MTAAPTPGLSDARGVGRRRSDVEIRESASRLRHVVEIGIEGISRFRAAFDHAPIGMALVGLDGRLAEVNRSLAWLLDRSETDLLASDLAGLTHPDDRAADIRGFDSLLEGETRTWQAEKRLCHSSGGAVWVRQSVSLVDDPAGQPQHFVVQFEDETERREADEQRREAAMQLEVTNRELRAAMRIQSELLAVAGHEFYTPLTPITGYTKILLNRWDDFTDERKRHFLSVMQVSAKQLTRQVDDMLLVSQLDRGVLVPNLEPLRVEDVVGAAVDNRALAERICINVTSVADLTIEADPLQIRRILEHFLENAFLYGAAPVDVDARSVEGGFIEITVSDAGPGVDPGFEPHVFARFAQASTGATRTSSGLGIGLSTASMLATVMGGSAFYRRPPGGGACFGVRLLEAEGWART